MGVNEYSELVPKDPIFDVEQQGLAKFAALKKSHPSVSVLVAIGEDIEDVFAFCRLSKTSEDTEAFAKNVLAWLNLYDYDGVVVQWKQPQREPGVTEPCHSRDELNNVIAVLRDTLGPWRILCVAVPNDNEMRRQNFDILSLSQSVNLFIVLTDWVLNRDRSSDDRSIYRMTSFPDPLNDVLQTKHALVSAGNVTLFRKFCFLLSIGGTSYTLVNSDHRGLHAMASGPGIPGRYTGLRGVLAFYEFCNQSWTTTVKGTFGSYVSGGNQWVGFLDVANLERVLWMILWKHRASCVGVSDVTLDDFRGVCGEAFLLTKTIAGWHDRAARSFNPWK